jgi:mannose-6-phosphate isomerase-like protein (cupin superfamily)
MCIQPGDDVGLEKHDDVDQFLRIESGRGRVQMGPTKDELVHEWDAGSDDAIFVPAGSWHNVTATGDEPLKLYSVYGPPDHDHGTIQHTKADPE